MCTCFTNNQPTNQPTYFSFLKGGVMKIHQKKAKHKIYIKQNNQKQSIKPAHPNKQLMVSFFKINIIKNTYVNKIVTRYRLYFNN